MAKAKAKKKSAKSAKKVVKKAAKPKVPGKILSATPHLVFEGALGAIEFYQKAFKAKLVLKMMGPGNNLVHAEMKIGEGRFMLAESNPQFGSRSPKSLGGVSVSMHLVVENADAIVAQAVAAGATIAMPVTDMFWGDRYGQVVDPFGHKWSIATQIKKMSPKQMQAATTKAMSAGPPQ